MDQPSTDHPKPKRRYGWWLCIALVVLLASLALPFLLPAYRQLALLERIEAAGGTVRTEPVGPEWLRNFLGEEKMRGFDDVVEIYASNSLIDDELLEDIGTLSKLKDLALDNTGISDSSLEHLKGLTNLTSLYLGNTKITDAGLVHLKGLTDLELLSLDDTPVSNTGLLYLKGLTNLKTLGLDGTQITDAGLVHLKELTNLELIKLIHTDTTVAGLKQFQAALPKCLVVY